MATQLQIRRGTAAQVAAFTGAEGEIVYNSTKDSLHTNDGSTAGGFELARADGSNFALTSAISTTANFSFGDGDKAIFGAGSDLQIYHDGTHSYVKNTTGNLYLQDDSYVEIGSQSGEVYIGAVKDGAVNLRFDNASKLATTASGILVSGSVVADALTISTTAFAGMNIQAGTSSVAAIDFGDSADTNIGGINYNNANDTLNLRSGNLNRLTINSSGNVGIGIASPTATLDVRRADASGKIAEFHQSTGFGLEFGSSQAQSYIEAGSNQTLLITVPSDMTIDSGGDINLDAGGGDIQLKSAGTAIGRLGLENGDLNIASSQQDYDIKFKGNDGGSTITALTLDMSAAGAATFAGQILAKGGDVANLSITSSIDPDTGFYWGGGNILGVVAGGTENARYKASETIFNEGSADIDFRVESDTKSHAFFIDGDGASNRLKIGMGTGTITNPYNQNNFTDLNLDGTWGGMISFKLGGAEKGFIGQNQSGNAGMVLGSSSGQSLTLKSGGNNDRLVIAADGATTLTAAVAINANIQNPLTINSSLNGIVYNEVFNTNTGANAAAYFGIVTQNLANSGTIRSGMFYDSLNHLSLINGEAGGAGIVLDDNNAVTMSGTLGVTGGLRASGAQSTPLTNEGLYGGHASRGAHIQGHGSANDVTVSNQSGAVALAVPQATVNVEARGDLAVTGALSKGSGSFRIDHPLKPETHQLVHSFTESPQADLLYSGVSALVDGAAEIHLDEFHGMTEGTFVALNRNIRVFTTNETDWEPIRGSVTGNILSISCRDTSCSDKVSWMVIGERQDQHMMDTEWTDEQGRVIVEPLKPEVPEEPAPVQRTVSVPVIVDGEQVTALETVDVPESIEVIDGVAVLTPATTKEVLKPQYEEIGVVDLDGNPVYG